MSSREGRQWKRNRKAALADQDPHPVAEVDKDIAEPATHQILYQDIGDEFCDSAIEDNTIHNDVYDG